MIELFPIECLHPFGPHIHVVIPEDPPVMMGLLNAFGLSARFWADVKGLEKLITPAQAALKTVVYESTFNEEPIWVIAHIIVKPKEFNCHMLFIRVDEEYFLHGQKVAELMKIELQKNVCRH